MSRSRPYIPEKEAELIAFHWSVCSELARVLIIASGEIQVALEDRLKRGEDVSDYDRAQYENDLLRTCIATLKKLKELDGLSAEKLTMLDEGIAAYERKLRTNEIQHTRTRA